jgi:hypothetical protein
MTEVPCANRSFLFSRHAPIGDHKTFETRVRVSISGARPGGGPLTYSAPSIGLPASYLMSHNAAIICKGGTHLIAYGGMHHTRTSEDWMGADYGIARRVADARQLPLKWGAARTVLSGTKSETGCVDRLNTPCEYDGKLSAIRWKGATLLFTRSNVSPEGGHRHVQVARSTDGIAGWSRFTQLRIEGATAGELDIYFFCVRRLADAAQPTLLGLFPGVRSGVGAIYATTSTSRDGIEWGAPRVLMPSDHRGGGRTADAPIDGQLPLAAVAPGLGRQPLRVSIQYAVDLRDYAALHDPHYDSDCSHRTYVCEHAIPERALGLATRRAVQRRPQPAVL